MNTVTANNKNILIVQGCGRPKGNTAQLVAAFADGATQVGRSVTLWKSSLYRNIRWKDVSDVTPAATESRVSKRATLIKSYQK